MLGLDLVGLLVGHGVPETHAACEQSAAYRCPSPDSRGRVKAVRFEVLSELPSVLVRHVAMLCFTHQDILVMHGVGLDVRDEDEGNNGRSDSQTRTEPERALRVSTFPTTNAVHKPCCTCTSPLGRSSPGFGGRCTCR